MKAATLNGELQKEPKYAADPITHEYAKRFYKLRGMKLKEVINELLLWHMDWLERHEGIARKQYRNYKIGMALPK